MSEQGWLGQIGAIAGLVGGVTGIAGVFLSFLALRRTSELKALDLRLELRRAESTLQSEIHDLLPLLEKAKGSRERLAAAQGSYHSGAMNQWLAQWDQDHAEAKKLIEGASVLDVDFSGVSQDDLERRLAIVHKLQRCVSQLGDRYRDSLSEDDLGRVQLREDQRAIQQARRQEKP